MTSARAQNRFLGVLVAILFFAVLEVVRPATAQAYALSGCSYAYKPVQYYVSTALPSGIRTAFGYAAADWTRYSRADMTSVLSGGKPRINVVGSNYGNVFEARVPNFNRCFGAPNGHLTVEVNTYFTSYSITRWRSIAGHEFGHALALAHAGAAGNPCGSAVPLMHPYTYDRYVRCNVFYPQPDDINGVHQRY